MIKKPAAVAFVVILAIVLIGYYFSYMVYKSAIHISTDKYFVPTPISELKQKKWDPQSKTIRKTVATQVDMKVENLRSTTEPPKVATTTESTNEETTPTTSKQTTDPISAVVAETLTEETRRTTSQAEYVNTESVGQTSMNKKGNWTIVYNTNAVGAVARRIHGSYFVPPKGEICQQRTPEAMIVGVSKSGTRELTDFMSAHPQIVIRHTKGNNYKISKKFFLNPALRKDIGKQMPCSYSNQIGMSKVDAYFYDYDRPEAIHKVNPNMKIIAIVREPISRTLSQFSFMYFLHNKKKLGEYNNSKMPFFDNKLVSKFGQVIESRMLSLSLYDGCLERYLKVFPWSQILIIESNEFKNDPVEVFNRVSTFLGLQTFPAEQHFVLNEEKNFYCVKEPAVDRHMTCYAGSRGRPPQKLKPKTRQKLIEYFQPHNERFFKLLGKRYDWTY